jgi:hypothetical protein
MNVRWASTLPLLLSIVLASVHSHAYGQGPSPAYGGPPGGGMPPGYGPGPPMGIPPSAMMPGPGAYPPPSPAYAPGQSFVSPPDDQGGMMGAPGMGGPEEGGYGGEGGGNCNLCDGAGCPHCVGGPNVGRRHSGLFHDLFGWLGPYPDGGCAAPRWYDFSLEYMYLEREQTVADGFDLTSDGIAGPIVLSTDDLEFDASHSFRFSAMIQAGAGSNWEFNYFGLHFFDSQASVVDPTNSLFSVFSAFGTAPPGGFEGTDESDFQQVGYSSDFDNFELNFRQRWSAANCRYQGSWLAGVRYFKLDEDFSLLTEADTFGGLPGPRQSIAFLTDVNNSLTGAQIGGDMWVCIIPGIRVGGELKGGVYGNHANSNNTITTSVGPTTFSESLVENDVAFIGEANLQALYRISYNWTLKFGYTMMYVDGVALAPDNFNTVPPAVLFPTPDARVASINTNSEVFYHGFTAGVEFLW